MPPSLTKRKSEGPADARRSPDEDRPNLEGSHTMPGDSLGHRSIVPFGFAHGLTATASIFHGGAVLVCAAQYPTEGSYGGF